MEVCESVGLGITGPRVRRRALRSADWEREEVMELYPFDGSGAVRGMLVWLLDMGRGQFVVLRV